MISSRYFKLLLLFVLSNYIDAMDLLPKDVADNIGLRSSCSPSESAATKSKKKRRHSSKRLKHIDEKLKKLQELATTQAELIKNLANPHQHLQITSQKRPEALAISASTVGNALCANYRLLEGARTSDIEKVRAALKDKACPWSSDSQENNGYTALHWAAFYGDTEIAKELIASGATNDSMKDANGAFPLHVAAGRGHAAIIKLLLPEVL
jgi:hypothetical protein